MKKTYKSFSPDGFEMIKRISYLELLLKCLCEKKDIDYKEIIAKLKDVEHFYYLNDNDVGYMEIMKKEGNKTRDQVAKEKIMKILEK